MSDQHEKVHTTGSPLMQLEKFWNKQKKGILIGLTIVAIVIVGWYGYQEYLVKPKETKAAEALFKAEAYFRMDSSNLVLNGDGQSRGALSVIKTYSGTKAANLAHYYAGISYLKLGDFNNAVKYLKEFSTSAKQIQMVATGALADAYAELNKKAEALENYKKAAVTFEADEANSSEYLFRAALLAETMGKTDEAVKLYKEIKEKYPKTDKGFQADRYLYRLSTEKTD